MIAGETGCGKTTQASSPSLPPTSFLPEGCMSPGPSPALSFAPACARVGGSDRRELGLGCEERAGQGRSGEGNFFRSIIRQAVCQSAAVFAPQVPQYLMEAAWAEGKAFRCFCTQPRRISAISVADRVAAERGEDVGNNVGYTIRLDSKGGANTSLMFCTNGVLLRMLTQVQAL